MLKRKFDNSSNGIQYENSETEERIRKKHELS